MGWERELGQKAEAGAEAPASLDKTVNGAARSPRLRLAIEEKV